MYSILLSSSGIQSIGVHIYIFVWLRTDHVVLFAQKWHDAADLVKFR